MAGNSDFSINIKTILDTKNLEAQLSAISAKKKSIEVDVKILPSGGLEKGFEINETFLKEYRAAIQSLAKEFSKFQVTSDEKGDPMRVHAEWVSQAGVRYSELFYKVQGEWQKTTVAIDEVLKRQKELLKLGQQEEQIRRRLLILQNKEGLAELQQRLILEEEHQKFLAEQEKKLSTDTQKAYKEEMALKKIEEKAEQERLKAREQWEKRMRADRIKEMKEREAANRQDAATQKYLQQEEEKRLRIQQKQTAEMQRMQDYARSFELRAAKLQSTPQVEEGKRLASQIVSSNDIEQVRTLTRELKIQDAVIRQSSKSMWSWGEQFKTALSRIVEYGAGLQLIYGGIREFWKGVGAIVALEKELTNIRLLQTEGAKTEEQIRRLAVSFNELAKEMGVSTQAVAEGSVQWMRQGRTLKETEKLLRSTMMLSKLGALEAAQASEYLTSTINGYKLSAQEAESVVDKLVAVDNAAATSAGDLALALQRTANIADESGVSLDTLIGYIATIQTVTGRSAATIGESLKSMFARLNNLKLGRLDDLDQSLSQVEEVLSRDSIGITLRKDAETFRDMSDVLDELGKKWKTLSDIDKQAAAQAIGGENYATI